MPVAKPCPVGARGVDSLPFSQGGTSAQAKALKASGVDFVALYLGVAGKLQNDACLDAGMMTFGVTLANRYDGVRSALQAKALGMPAGTTLFCDVEGMTAYTMPIAELVGKINAWSDEVTAAGYMPGVYIASPQPMTSAELHALRSVRYWKAPARIVDRNGELAEPKNGWCMFQMHPQHHRAGVWVDVNMVGHDFKGRAPTMCSK